MMRKILILFVVGMLFVQTACGTKKEEETKKEPTNNTQEEKNELTDEDYKKITSVMETSRKDDKTSLVKITYKNASSKEFKVKTIKVVVKKEEKEILSKTKEINEKIAAASEKTYEIELDIPIEKLGDENIDINWEMES